MAYVLQAGEGLREIGPPWRVLGFAQPSTKLQARWFRVNGSLIVCRGKCRMRPVSQILLGVLKQMASIVA